MKQTFAPPRRQFWILLATVLGSSVAILDGSIVNLALPKIASDLHIHFASLQWIVDGYLLSLSALILLGGSLGDILGRKKVYLTGLIGFGVSSVLCAMAPNVVLLISARVAQGLFGALLVPGALAIINTSFAPQGRSKAIGQWTAWSSIAIVLAPLIGGGVLEIASWRWIFLINIPLIIGCFALAAPSITDSKDGEPRHIDIAGAAFAGLGLAGLIYGLIEGPARRWSVLPLTLLGAGIVLLATFLVWETRTKDPMVKLSLFKSRNFVGSNLMTFAMYGALSGFTFSLMIYLQTRMHYSSIAAGFSIVPTSILLMLFSGKIGALAGKFGPRPFMTIGPLIAASGMGLLYFLQPGTSYVFGVLPGILLFGIGMTLLVSPLTTTVMASVSDANSGIASGINNAVARAAGLVVIALLGLLGSTHAYTFATSFCAILAASGGILSYFIIEGRTLARKLQTDEIQPNK